VSVWTRMADWLGFSQRAAVIDPLTAALTARYTNFSTPVTPESAARKIAVGSSIRLISNTSRTMRVESFTGTGGTTKKLTPSPLMTDPDATGRGLPDWVAQATWSLGARGNLMVQILARDSFGRPIAMQVLHPDLVKPDLKDGELSGWKVSGGQTIPVRDVLHRRMYPVPGQVIGMSPIEQHAASIGVGIAAEKFGGDFFESGGHPTGMLKSDAPLTEDQALKVKSKFIIAADSREPVLMPGGIEYQQIQIAPGESQFLDAQGYSSAECARIFGPGMPEMLGYETGGSMTYSNVVDRDLQFLKLTLDPYLVIIEDLLTDCLPKPHYARFNRDSLLRMAPLDRFKLYQLQQLTGFSAPNEQRDLENLPPVPWGDKPYATAKLTETDAVSGTAPDGLPAAPAPKTGGQQ
jgi:HK97 family phage portal protein